MKAGMIGIGLMGSGMVKNIRKAGIPAAFVVHENRSRVEALTETGATEVAGYAELAAECDAIMVCVPDSPAVEAVLLGGDGIGPHLREGQIVIDLSTSYPPSTRSIAATLKERGITLLDAPVTGSRPEAEAGTLHVMCAGPKEAFDAVKPVFDAIAADVFHVGPSGAGHAIKLINNYLGQISLAALCEVLPFAAKYDVDLQSMYDVISVSGGNSKCFQGVMPRFMKRDFDVGFRLGLAHKDIRYINDLARSQNVPTPLASALLSILDMAAARGYGDEDRTALLKFWESMSPGST